MEMNSASQTRPEKVKKCSFNLRNLRLSLKFRPEIYKLILKMRHRIRKKTRLLITLKKQLKNLKNLTTASSSTQTNDNNIQESVLVPENDCKQVNNTKHQDAFTQTDEPEKDTSLKCTITDVDKTQDVKNSNLECANVASVENNSWNLNSEENEKSIAEQVKEAAQSAMQQSGMVFVESAGMYYDYKTGYYYSADLGLYYHPDTGCYYTYSEDKQTFEFHSYPDRSKSTTNPHYEAHEKKKARKLRKEKEDNEEIKAKRRKKNKKRVINGDTEAKDLKESSEENEKTSEKDNSAEKDETIEEDVNMKDINEDRKKTIVEDLEEGECSDSEEETGNEKDVIEVESSDGDDSDASVSTVSNDDDSIAKHHPPCMRVIVKDTNLPKLKMGTLFLVTKDGGTVGREGSAHTILIEDSNVSRNHLDIRYDMSRRSYTVTDLGSKNGTILNGVRISESQVVSEAVEVMHGSTLQLGETKLLCHIHPGVDTCGHCEPGLVMETQEKEKKAAYTRTCSVQKQHQLELARLKNKYAPKPLAIEETAYNDRAKERRQKVGSSHHSEKTQTSDLDTFIAPENKGFKLLEKMGWSKGEGLGKDNQGDTEPIPLVGNEGTSGLGTGASGPPPLVPKFTPKNTLGTSTMRLAAKTKLLQPPAKAFQDPLEDDSE